MYKLRKGVELPKEFKIKVNPEQSKALQEYLFSISYSWNNNSKEIQIMSNYLFAENQRMTYLLDNDENFFKNTCLPEIDFQDYFEPSFPEKWCIKVTEENYQELNVWMHQNWKNYPKYTDEWEVEKNAEYFYSHSLSGYNGSSFEPKGTYTLITTEQFRERFVAKEEKVFKGIDHKFNHFAQGNERVLAIIPKDLIEKIKDSIIEDNRKVISTLDAENKKLKGENDILKRETWIQKSEVERLKSHIEYIKDYFDVKIQGYTFEVQILRKENKKLKKQIKMLSLR